MFQIFGIVGVIISGTVAGLAFIKLFVLPHRIQRKNREW